MTAGRRWEVDLDTDAAVERALRQRYGEAAIGAIVCRANEASRRGSHHQTDERAFTREVERWRTALDDAVDGAEVFAATQFVESLSQQDDRFVGSPERPADHTRGIFAHPDDAENRGRINRVAVPLVVEADV